MAAIVRDAVASQAADLYSSRRDRIPPTIAVGTNPAIDSVPLAVEGT
jgi:hypothetical protein